MSTEITLTGLLLFNIIEYVQDTREYMNGNKCTYKIIIIIYYSNQHRSSSILTTYSMYNTHFT